MLVGSQTAIRQSHSNCATALAERSAFTAEWLHRSAVTAAPCGRASRCSPSQLRGDATQLVVTLEDISALQARRAHRCARAKRGSRSRWKRASCRCGTGTSSATRSTTTISGASRSASIRSELLQREALHERLMLPPTSRRCSNNSSSIFTASTIALRMRVRSCRRAFGKPKWFRARAKVVRRDADGKAAARRSACCAIFRAQTAISRTRSRSSSAGNARCAVRRTACTTGIC